MWINKNVILFVAVVYCWGHYGMSGYVAQQRLVSVLQADFCSDVGREIKSTEFDCEPPHGSQREGQHDPVSAWLLQHCGSPLCSEP